MDRKCLISVYLMTLVSATYALKCFQCVSTTDSKCKDDVDSLTAAECPAPGAMEENFCRTVEETVNGIAIVTRSCSTRVAGSTEEYTEDAGVKVSFCRTDGCNGRTGSTPTTGLKCYQCTSVTSSKCKDGIRSLTPTACPAPPRSMVNFCGTVESTVGGMAIVTRSCSSRVAGSTEKYTEAAGVKVSFCRTDGCNGRTGSTPTTGLKCYQCTSVTSSKCKDGIRSLTPTACPAPPRSMVNFCGTVESTVGGIAIVTRSCSVRVAGSTDKYSEAAGVKVSFCRTDGCNGRTGSTPIRDLKGSSGVIALNGLKCYQCTSVTSSKCKDGIRSLTPTACPAPPRSMVNFCGTVESTIGGIAIVTRRCSARAAGSTEKYSEAAGVKVSFCRTDGCNGRTGSTPTTGLKCYQCTSVTSSKCKDGIRSLTPTACPAPPRSMVNFCGTVESTVGGIAIVTRSCSARVAGSTEKYSEAAGVKVSFCKTDGCNGRTGSTPITDVFVVQIADIVTLFRRTILRRPSSLARICD